MQSWCAHDVRAISLDGAWEIPAGAEDKINEIGFGLYQVHVFVLCAGPFVPGGSPKRGGTQQGSVLFSGFVNHDGCMNPGC